MGFISNLPKVKIYSDGASRGNPGPSAIAFMILGADDQVLKRYSTTIGIGTNNEAEYKALMHALRVAVDFADGEVACYLDSELVVRQLNREYKVSNPSLKVLWHEVNQIKQRFRNVSFEYLPRTDINMQKVDKMAKKTLHNIKNFL